MFMNTSAADTPRMGISFQVFYDEMLPYGDWIDDPVHGYVWVPNAGPGFQPYASNGYWVMSTYGNTWVSNYDWGWAPFHYGRWYYDDYLGWAWVPGYEWGPAWVNWRTGGGYYGWAPLMPGLNIRVAIDIPSHYYVFVPRRRLISRNIYNYYVPRRNVYRVYNQTTIINNTYVYNNKTYISGPQRQEIENVTRRSVPVYQVSNSNRPGRSSIGRNTLQVYQPAVREASNSRNGPEKPSRVVTASERRQYQANRSNSRSSTGTGIIRTAPENSRTSQTRIQENSRLGSGAGRRVESNTPNGSRSNENARVPSNSSRSAQVNSRNSSVEGHRENNVNAPSHRNVQAPKKQNPPNVRQRPAQSNQVRSTNPAPKTNTTVRNSRPKTQVQPRGSSRSRNATQVSTNTRQSNSGTATRSGSSSLRSGRGNN